MKELKNTILLISYTFPPYPGIGGRRWAKFAKYLSRNGYIVHVVHAKSPFKEKSLWLCDVENNENIIRHEIKDTYPMILTMEPKSLLEKVRYKLALILVKIFSKGTYYDRGIYWRKKMFATSQQLISQHDIMNVIVSSAPFSTAYYAINLKKIFKNLKLLVDLRDPWTWGEGYGMTQISANRKNYELNMEMKVLKLANYISIPSAEMLSYLSNFYPEQRDKLILLPHAFDGDEIQVHKKYSSEATRLILYGTLYGEMGYVFNKLANYLAISSNSITLDIYSNSERYKNIFIENGLDQKKVNYYNSLRPKDLFRRFASYDFVLIIQPDYAKDFITTKIYEIIYSKTPIVLIAKVGLLSDYIMKNELGWHIDSLNLDQELKILCQLKSMKHNVRQFAVEENSYSNVTKFLISSLEDKERSQ